MTYQPDARFKPMNDPTEAWRPIANNQLQISLVRSIDALRYSHVCIRRRDSLIAELDYRLNAADSASASDQTLHEPKTVCDIRPGLCARFAFSTHAGLSMRHRIDHVVHANLGAEHREPGRVARVVEKLP